MVGRGPRSAIERAEIGNSRPTVVRACALLDLSDGLCLTRGMEKARAGLLRGGKTTLTFRCTSQERPPPQGGGSVCPGLPGFVGQAQAPGVRATAQPSAVFLRAARVVVSMPSV